MLTLINSAVNPTVICITNLKILHYNRSAVSYLDIKNKLFVYLDN